MSLNDAISIDDHQTVVALLAQNPNLEAVDPYNNTPLHLATIFGSFSYVQLLLSAGANPNTRKGHNDFPLSLAVHNDDYKIAELLLSHGADPNACDLYTRPVLLVAVVRNNYSLIELLLHHGANPNIQNLTRSTPLHLAVFLDHHDIVYLLIQYGGKLTLLNESNKTPIHLASSSSIFNHAIKTATACTLRQLCMSTLRFTPVHHRPSALSSLPQHLQLEIHGTRPLPSSPAPPSVSPDVHTSPQTLRVQRNSIFN